MDENLFKNESSSISQMKPTQVILIEGLIQNLPEILSSMKDIFRMSRQEKVIENFLKFRLEEMKLSKDNFHILVSSLTELSKDRNTDEETKTLYKYMIKELFNIFLDKMNKSNDFTEYINSI